MLKRLLTIIADRLPARAISCDQTGRPYLNRLTGNTFHRVILPAGSNHQPQACWTLFAHSIGDTKRWGFKQLIDGREVYRDYQYPTYHGQKPINWWRTAPTGRALRQQQSQQAVH